MQSDPLGDMVAETDESSFVPIDAQPIDKPMPPSLLGFGDTPPVTVRLVRRRPARHDADFAQTRASRVYRILALAVLGWTAYIGFLPFDWQWVPMGVAFSRLQQAFLTVLQDPISRTDALANVLLFVPLGFSLSGVLLFRAHGLRRAAGSILVVVLSLSASVFVEFGQLFVRERVPSGVDVLMQVVGCGIGIVLWVVGGPSVTRWAVDTWSARPYERAPRALAGLTGLWVLSSLAPFDISLDVGDLAARWRAGQIVPIPFGTGLTSPAIADGLLQMLGTIALGAFARLHVLRSPIAAFGVGLLAVIAVELAQVFVMSHAADATDILSGGIGVALGAWIARRLPETADDARRGGLVRRADRALLWVVAWALALCAYFWVPFDFSIDAGIIAGKLDRITFIPFLGYLNGSPLTALDDFSRTLALSIPLGWGVAYLRSLRTIAARVLAVFGAVAFFATIELGQFFLLTRTPDPTDVLTGAIGFYLGIRLLEWLRDRPVVDRDATGAVTMRRAVQ